MAKSWRMRLAAVAFAAAGLAAPMVQAQQAKPAAYTKGTVLIVDYAALDKMLTDPKDRPMAEAIGLLPARVRELPREIKQMPPEAARLMTMAATCIGKPGRLMVTYDGENPSGGLFGYGVAFSVQAPDQKYADEMHAVISGLVGQSGQKVKTKDTRWTGMSDIQTPVGILSFGPRQAKDGWRYEVVFGTMENADEAAAQAMPTTKEFEPCVRMRLDLAGLTPLKGMAEGFAGKNPQVGETFKGLEDLGLVGDNAVKISYLAGSTKEESVSMFAWEGIKKYAAKMHMTAKTLTKEDFAAVPADACDAYVARMSEDGFGYILDSLMQAGPEAQQGLDQFEKATGVNLRTDLLDALGGTVAAYMSDTTGGGGLSSAVGMITFKDRAKVVSAMNKLAATANGMADQLPIGPGYIKLASWKDGATDLLTLRFPGLPVPLELTFAMTEKWLIVSPTPQGTIAAARQASGKGDAGLASNALFKGRVPGKEMVSVSFSDTARHLREGYGALAHIGSAVANAMRSPTDPNREPGLLVPGYNDLAKGVRARVSYSYWKGEDLITETHSDRSALVGVAGAAGVLSKIVPLIAIPAAVGASQQKGMMGMANEADLVRLGLRAMPVGTMSPAQLMLAVMPREAVELMGVEGVN